ncbi:hypothetical protein [Kitasatospora sp. P5_F3]
MTEKIDTTDARRFTVTLKTGWTFHDGTPVLDQVPPSAPASYRTDLGDRAIDSPQGAIQNIGFTLDQGDWSGAGSNDTGYSSPQFDRLSTRADQTATLQDTVAGYREAQQVLAQDVPAIPLWYTRTTSGFSTHVQNVGCDSFGNPVWTEVQVKG